MKLLMFRPLWGVVRTFDGGRSFAEALKAIAALGYDGIEVPFKAVYTFGEDNFRQQLRDNNLKVGFQIFTDGPNAPGAAAPWGGPYSGHPAPSPSVESHLSVFQAQVQSALEFDPTFINSHSGNDYFTSAMAKDFFGKALELQESIGGGTEVLHETHRKRILYSPWVARDLLEDFPTLALTADFSHWINVAETNSADPVLRSVIKQVAPQVKHVHARVGYDHGPQVADPRAPEWLPYTEGHEVWWQDVFAAQHELGNDVMTLAPEHGPPNYQQTLPYTRQPIADIWSVNHWVALRQQKLFGDVYGHENTSKLVEQS